MKKQTLSIAIIILFYFASFCQTPIQTKTVMDGVVRNQPSSLGTPINYITYNTEIYVTKYVGLGYWQTNYRDQSGYINDLYLNVNQDMLKIEYAYKSELDTAEARKHIVEQQQRLIDLTNKYGKEKAMDIISGTLWIGMSTTQAIEAIGNPDDIRRTTNSYGVSEQWIYPNHKYLYFENYKLTTVQD